MRKSGRKTLCLPGSSGQAYGVVKMGGLQLPWDTDIDMAMAKSEWPDMSQLLNIWKSKWGFGPGFKIYKANKSVKN